LNAACKPVFDEFNELIAERGLFVDGKNYPVEFLFGGDMKFLQIILGLGSSLSTHACPWCRIHKSDRANMCHSLILHRLLSLLKACRRSEVRGAVRQGQHDQVHSSSGTT
jgi:hypothetical protein